MVHAVNGMHQARVNNPKAARIAYERALELSPGFLEAIGGLTVLDLAAKNPASAIARLEAEIAKQPANAPLLILVGSSAQCRGRLREGGTGATPGRVSVTLDFTTGYAMLAQLYLRQKRTDEARAEFEGMVQRDPSGGWRPDDDWDVADQQGKHEEAIKVYATAVSGTENAPVAANNLAFIYAEQGTNLDVALQLATAAKQRLPNDPNVDDTIGWIYYKKGMANLAVKPFEESLKKRPDQAEVLFHLGLAYAKLDEKAKARDALERALKLNPQIGGEEARRVLASVSK